MTDKKLTDVELIQLIDHMKDKEIITRLNLRRNKIRNRGVKALAEFITKHDSTLTEINLNRNLITQDGVQALLNAIHGTIRFSDIKIGYGNKSTPE
jgi:Ran GTPase-activating protein (RanGAP) involved in mRNA processing and transport